MTRSAYLLAATCAVLAATPSLADGIGLKPGLWETRIVKQIVDGKDQSGQQAAAMDKMQQAMKTLSPEQRAMMQGMMKQHGVGISDNGSVKLCISPQMASRDKPIIDKDGRCEPTTMVRNGKTFTYEFNCTEHGETTRGKGESTSSGDMITNRSDVTHIDAQGKTHAMQIESEMRFLGADCGDIKPPDGAK